MWAVKWYRGNFEIFRFIADEDPPTKIFKLDNFDVDVSGFGVEVEVDVDLDVEEMTFQKFTLLCN